MTVRSIHFSEQADRPHGVEFLSVEILLSGIAAVFPGFGFRLSIRVPVKGKVWFNA
jgi:hypothetical protein